MAILAFLVQFVKYSINYFLHAFYEDEKLDSNFFLDYIQFLDKYSLGYYCWEIQLKGLPLSDVSCESSSYNRTEK